MYSQIESTIEPCGLVHKVTIMSSSSSRAVLKKNGAGTIVRFGWQFIMLYGSLALSRFNFGKLLCEHGFKIYNLHTE